MKILKVTCAIIEKGGQTLVVQRSDKMNLPLKWEFPGGKIEENESVEECIIREIKEELNIEIELISRLATSNFNYSNFSIQLIPFIARHTKGAIRLSEHKQYLWMSNKNLKNLDWAEADIPIVNEYLNL